jgi:hypothetical protein
MFVNETAVGRVVRPRAVAACRFHQGLVTGADMTLPLICVRQM